MSEVSLFQGFKYQEFKSTMSGVSLFQGFKYQEFKSTGVQEYQMSGNNIIIMSSPRKSDNHEYAM